MIGRLMLFNVTVTFPQLFLHPDNCLYLLSDYWVRQLFLWKVSHGQSGFNISTVLSLKEAYLTFIRKGEIQRTAEYQRKKAAGCCEQVLFVCHCSSLVHKELLWPYLHQNSFWDYFIVILLSLCYSSLVSNLLWNISGFDNQTIALKPVRSRFFLCEDWNPAKV